MRGDDDRKFGVVLFDDVEDPGAGWSCSVPGVATRVNGPNALSTDTIWWTNIPYDHFFRRTEIWRIPNLRHDKYLVVSPQDVLREWGHDPQALGPDFVASICAIAFDRIMRMSWGLIREVNPKLRLTQAFVGKTLREDLRPLLPGLDYPQGETISLVKSGQAWEEFTATGARGPKGGRWITLRRPRVSYAMEIMQTPVPKGPFEYISRASLVTVTNNKVRYVQDSKSPCMVEVVVNSMQPEISPIYGFGNAIDKEKKVPRSWVAHPEFLVLSRYADLDVKTIWQGKEYWAMMLDLPPVVREFFKDRYTETSWSAGVVAETIWRAVVLGEDKSKAGPLREGESLAQTSWPGMWFRASDKSSMFQLSLRLAELGYTVMSYGLGWVRCAVPEDEIVQFMKDGLSFGLIPQLADIPDGSFKPNTTPWNGDPASKMLAMLTMNRQHNLLWKMDQVPLLTPDKRAAAVKDLFAKHQGGA